MVCYWHSSKYFIKVSGLCAGGYTMPIIAKTTLLLAAVLTSGSFISAQDSRNSDATLNCNVTLAEPSDTSTLRVDTIHVASYDDRSMSSVNIRNMTERSIESVLILAEFLNTEGKHLETGLYYATTDRFPDQMLHVQKGFGIQRLSKPLGPHRSMNLSAVSDIVLLSCPTTGIVSKLDVHFDDGSTWSKSSPTWVTDPVFREATVDMRAFPKTVPFTFWAIFELNAQGRATVIETEDSDGELLSWLQTQLDAWSIVPGDRGPLAKDTQRFVMLVRVNARNTKYPTRKWMLKSQITDSPVIIVDISPDEPSRSQLPVMIGGMIASQHAVGSVR
jgi:hypothetical protein